MTTKEEINEFLKEREIALAKHVGRMELLNKQTEELIKQMKETNIKLRRLI